MSKSTNAGPVKVCVHNTEEKHHCKQCGGMAKVGEHMHDPVNQPKHYTRHPSGTECIDIAEHMGFNLGNALKYIWRCDLKLDAFSRTLKKPNGTLSVKSRNGVPGNVHSE